MSYTLRGRMDSRLGAALAPAVAAAILALVLHRWWPVEVAGLMVAVGLALSYVWLGLTLAFYTDWPTSFWITALSAAVYFASLLPFNKLRLA